MDPYKLGKCIGFLEMGAGPRIEGFCTGVSDAWDSEEGGPMARLLVKAARDLLVATGRGQTAPAYHLHLITKTASWHSHCRDVADHVAKVMKATWDFTKQASLKDIVGGGTFLGRGALYSAMGLGGGLGALYWLLSRHANQDASDMEAMRHQIKYYNQLSSELEDSMRRKYRYDRGEQQSPTEAI